MLKYHQLWWLDIELTASIIIYYIYTYNGNAAAAINFKNTCICLRKYIQMRSHDGEYVIFVYTRYAILTMV